MKYKELLERFTRLESRLDFLEKENKKLVKENIFLKGRLTFYENPKNSRNSSMPPSKDENRPKPNQSLRKSSVKTLEDNGGEKVKH